MLLSSASLPCNLSMDKLVDSVGPQFIYDYLEKTLDFLTSNAKEYRLPKLLPSKEEFLQRIAKDHAYLLYPVYNQKCSKVIDAIKTVLDLNRNVFRWSCCYQNLSNNTHKESYLVYTKQYFVLPTPKISDRLKVRLGPPQTPTTTTTEIATTLKLTFLNTTLKFIKDGERFYLRYPEMSFPEVEYFRKLLESPSMDEEVGLGFKSLYTPLWEAMRIFSLKYEFEITVVATAKSFACLVLHKVPKFKIIVKQDEQIAPQTTGTYQPTHPTVHLSKSLMKKVNQKTALLGNVSASFVDQCLRSMLEFIDNDKKYATEFSNLTIHEATFYTSVFGISKTEELINLFEEKHKVILRTIHRILKTVYRDYLMSTLQKRMSGRSSEFTVSIVKKLKKKVRNRLMNAGLSEFSITLQSASSKGSVAANKIQLVNNNAGVSVSSSSLQLTSSKSSYVPNIVQPSLENNNLIQLVGGAQRNRSPSNSRASRSKSAINFSSGGIINPHAHTIDKVNTTDNTTIDKQSSKRSEESVKSVSLYSKHHQKIIEDMSVPLESDKATRMMKLMGWDGGALGARGDGITEPIQPAFQIKTGAGLGHTPPMPNAAPKTATKAAPKANPPKHKPLTVPQKSSPFRLDFLRYIAKLIIDDCAKMVIKLDSDITKKQYIFVRDIIDALNGRRKIVLRDETEVELVMMISDSLEKCKDLRLSVDMSSNKTELTLKKEVYAQSKSKLDTTQQLQIPNLSKKSFRIAIIKSILDFLKSDQISKEFEPVWQMTRKNITCLKETVKKVNARSLINKEDYAYFVYTQMLSCIGDLILELQICSSKKKFVLHKKRFDGSPPQCSPKIIEAVVNKNNDCNIEEDNDEVIYVHIENEVVEIYDSDSDSEISKSSEQANIVAEKQAIIEAEKEVTIGGEKEANIEAEKQANIEVEKQANIGVEKEATIEGEKEANMEVDKEAKMELENEADVEANILVKEANNVATKQANIIADKQANNVAEEARNLEAIDANYETAKVVNVEAEKETAIDANIITPRVNVGDKDVNTHEMSKDNDKDVNKAVTDQKSNLMDIVESENVNFNDNIESSSRYSSTVDVKEENVISNISDINASSDIHSKIANELSNLAMAINESVKLESNKTNEEVNKTNTTKRGRTETESNNNNIVSKKPKNDFTKLVCITSDDSEMPKSIQMKLYENIDKSPLLQCHGLIAGYLIFACFDQNTSQILENISKELNFTIVDFQTFQIDKMFSVELKMRCYFDFNVLESLKVYNELNCDKWTVLNKRNVNEYVYIDVEVDGETVQLISNCNFSMDVGVDRLQFTVLSGRHKTD